MTFDEYKQATLRYIDAYNVGGWRVAFTERTIPHDDGYAALCHTNMPNKQAIIEVYPGADERVALHEVLHIMTADIYHTLLSTVPEREANRLIHGVIQHIVNKELGVI